MIELLLAHGADLTARKSDGQTPLAVALANDKDAAATLLRERGATA
jgi:ankyrin repeat protein